MRDIYQVGCDLERQDPGANPAFLQIEEPLQLQNDCSPRDEDGGMQAIFIYSLNTHLFARKPVQDSSAEEPVLLRQSEPFDHNG